MSNTILQSPRSRHDPKLRGPFAAICLVTSASVCLLGTWRVDVHSMEGIIANGAEHMLRTHEWWVPKLYGTTYGYKPALAYWLSAGSMKLLGRSEFALRLPSGLCGVALTLVVFYALASLVNARCGLYAGLAMTLSALFIEQGRIAGFDMPLTLGVGGAILCAVRNLSLRECNVKFWVLAYLSLLFGFLAKGLPAIGMYGPGLLVCAILARQVRQLFSWQHAAALLLGCSIAALYLYFVYRSEGPLAMAQAWGEFTSHSSRWDLTRVARTLLKPLVIFVAFLPASGLLLIRLAPSRPRMPTRARRLATGLRAFLLVDVLIWILVPINSTRYYFPLAVPIAALAGLAAEALSPNAFRKDRRWLPAAKTALFKALKPGVVMTALGALYCASYVVWFQPSRTAFLSERPVAEVFRRLIPPGEVVYVNTFDAGSSLFYYLEHPVRRWDLQGPPHAEPMPVVLFEGQELLLRARTDLEVRIVSSGQARGRYHFQLAWVAATGRLPYATRPE